MITVVVHLSFVSVVEDLTGERKTTEVKEGAEMVKEELQLLLNQFRTGKENYMHVAKLLFYSANFRSIVLDLFGIMQEGFKDIRFEKGHEEVEPKGNRVESEGLKELAKSTHGEGTTKTTEATKTTKKQRHFTEEQLNILADRFITWLRRVHDAPECIEALDFINTRFSEVEGLELLNVTLKDKSTLNEQEMKIYEAAQQSEPVKIGIATKVFVEHWINTSLDPLLKTLDGLRLKLVKDKDSKTALSDFSQWLKSCLKESDFMANQGRRKEEFKSHVKGLQVNFADRYRGDVDHLMQEAANIGERIRRDELSLKLSSDVQDLMKHLFRDEQGNLTIKHELWSDLKLILPLFLGRLRFIQIPEIVVNDESVNFFASGISISVGELAPKRLQAHFYSDLDVGARDIIETTGEEYDLETVFVIEAGKIFAEARNIYFEMDRKSFPPLSDTGIADLNIHGDDGMCLRLVFGTSQVSSVGPTRVTPVGVPFKLLSAKCTIDKLDLRLHETKHSWMYTVLGPLIRRQLRMRIEQEIEKFFMKGEWLETITQPQAIAEALLQSAPVSK